MPPTLSPGPQHFCFIERNGPWVSRVSDGSSGASGARVHDHVHRTTGNAGAHTRRWTHPTSTLRRRSDPQTSDRT